VFAPLTPQNQPHAKKWLTPLFGFARPPPKARNNKQNFVEKLKKIEINNSEKNYTFTKK
jgi:hypothetical protein